MEDKDLISLILTRLEQLGSCARCHCYEYGCLASSCTGCSDHVLDKYEYDEAMRDIYKMIEEDG